MFMNCVSSSGTAARGNRIRNNENNEYPTIITKRIIAVHEPMVNP